MKAVFVVLSFLSGFLLFLSVFSQLLGKRALVAGRLAEMQSKKHFSDQREEELEKPFIDRVVMPFLRWITLITSKLAPVKKNSNLERKLIKAGEPLGLKPDEFVAVYYAMMVFSSLLGLGIAFVQGRPVLSMILYTALGLIIGYALVEIWLKTLGQNRADAIGRNLPDVLDLLTVSVEAGLGFDAALARVTEKVKGPVSEEIGATLQEMKMGKPRREALRDLGNRTGVEELQTFVSSVIQADQLGVSIGNVLRSQALQNRMKRRQKVEEKAMKAPIKMLIPLMLFIFPTIFIVVLAPAVVQMMENLGK